MPAALSVNCKIYDRGFWHRVHNNMSYIEEFSSINAGCTKQSRSVLQIVQNKFSWSEMWNDLHEKGKNQLHLICSVCGTCKVQISWFPQWVQMADISQGSFCMQVKKLISKIFLLFKMQFLLLITRWPDIIIKVKGCDLPDPVLRKPWAWKPGNSTVWRLYLWVIGICQNHGNCIQARFYCCQ